MEKMRHIAEGRKNKCKDEVEVKSDYMVIR